MTMLRKTMGAAAIAAVMTLSAGFAAAQTAAA